MFRIVQHFTTPQGVATLIETPDAMRWLMISQREILSDHLWQQAVESGAVGVIALGGEGEFFALLTECVQKALSSPLTLWMLFPHVPTFVEAMERSEERVELSGGFVHLHTHSEYSALDGLSTVKELAFLAAEDENPALAITDHGNCAGHPALQRACDEAGVKPIFGMEAYFIDDRRERPEKGDVEAAKRLRGYKHLILLAKDDEGLHNLWAMSTEGYRDGFYYKPRIDWDTLQRHSRGIIATSACLGGPLSQLLLDGDFDGARSRLGRLLEVFGEDFYIEIQPAELEEQRRLNPLLVKLAHDLSVPLVAAADGHFPAAGQKEIHKTWLACQTSADNEDYWHFDHTMTEGEMRSRLAYLGPQVVDEAVGNTVKIAAQCDARIESKTVMPIYYRQGGYDRDAAKVREMCEANWGRIKSTIYDQDVYRARFERELDLISRKKYCFPAETKITMGDGRMKVIRDIKVGDLVRTRDGAEPVVVLHRNQVDDPLAIITVYGSHHHLMGTTNHPVLTPEGWCDLGDVQAGDEVLVGDRVPLLQQTFDLVALAIERGWRYTVRDGFLRRIKPGRWGTDRPRKGEFPAQVEYSESLMYLLGLWGAEGHMYDVESAVNPAQIGWTLNRNNHRVIHELESAARALGIGTLRRYDKASACAPEHQGVTFMVTNHPLALLIEELIGRGVFGKNLHPWITEAPDEYLRAFLEGWFDGDGYSQDGNRRLITTANENIALQLRDIVLRLGVWATVTRHKNGEGLAYRVCWQEGRIKAPYGARSRPEGGWWVRVKTATRQEFSGEVYNISVNGDPTYVAEGIRVHNCGYFLMVADYVCWAKDNGILVGPGRGSGAGSLIAFLMRITEVDPVHYDIIFERFITEGRETLPDFDVDYPASKRVEIQDYIRDKYGEDRVLKVGTHLRYKSKGIIGKLFGVFRDRGLLAPDAFEDARKISAIISEAEAGTAGLGLSWDDLWVQEGDQLEPYRLKYPELFALAEQLVGRLNSYGQHPAGMIISTEGSLLDRLPLRRGDDEGLMITQFEFDDLDRMGLIKFDILTIRTLDTLQATVDGAREHFKINVNIYDFDVEYDDPMIWEEISNGNTMGMFQIETASGTRLAKRLCPLSISDLADMGSVVRPGPMRSGLTEVYLRRRAGEEPVSFPDARMEEFLKPTQGVMIFQEQVMQACMTLAGYDSTEADAVRKILGKKQVDKVVQAGYKFVDGCVANGMLKADAQVLWDQMSEFAKYGFGKAHAVAYAMITYWTAWLKVHYPVPTLTALLSTVDKERVPEFVKEARRLGVAILPPDINVSGQGFRPDGNAIRYGLDAIKGVGDKAVQAVIEGQPYTDYVNYLETKGSAANSGITHLLVRVGVFDSIIVNRRALVELLDAQKDGTSSRCVFKTRDGSLLPDVCSFDWASEPVPVNPRTGKNLKPKPLPKKCTKACRQYTAPEPMAMGLVPQYSDREIRDIEADMLGVHLSSTAFDVLEDEDRKALFTQAEQLDRATSGVYMVAGVISKMRKHRDRTDREMAFFNLDTEAHSFDVACFADIYATFGVNIKVGTLVLCELKRDSRGNQLKTLYPLES